jgi:hypothetical protein
VATLPLCVGFPGGCGRRSGERLYYPTVSIFLHQNSMTEF